MRKRKFEGGHIVRDIIGFFENNKPREVFEEVTSEWTLHRLTNNEVHRSFAIAVFPSHQSLERSDFYPQFLDMANYYSEYPWFISIN